MKQTLPPLVRLPELLELTGGVSKNTLYRWMREKRFPKQRKIGPRAVAWLRTDVQKWLEGLEVSE